MDCNLVGFKRFYTHTNPQQSTFARMHARPRKFAYSLRDSISVHGCVCIDHKYIFCMSIRTKKYLGRSSHTSCQTPCTSLSCITGILILESTDISNVYVCVRVLVSLSLWLSFFLLVFLFWMMCFVSHLL